MSVISKSLLASVAILFSSSLPLYAQSLAEAVIEEYFAEMGQSGMTVTPGTKTVSGNTVEWSDVVFGLPSDGGTYTLPWHCQLNGGG